MQVHTFTTTAGAYNASQTRDDIHDGDVLYVPSENAIAIMVSAWPTALTPEHAGGAFHELAGDVTWDSVPNLDGGLDDYRASADLARRTLAAREAADTSTTFHDPLVIGKSVRYTTTGPWGDASGSGTYLGVALDEEDRVPYHYFVDGEVNGLAQGAHGFPAKPGTPLTTPLTPTALIRGARKGGLDVAPDDPRHDDYAHLVKLWENYLRADSEYQRGWWAGRFEEYAAQNAIDADTFSALRLEAMRRLEPGA